MLRLGKSHIPSQPVYVNSGLWASAGHMTPSNYSSYTVSPSLRQLCVNRPPLSSGLQASSPGVSPQG